MGWRFSSVVECLLGTCDALGSIHRSTEKQASFSFSFCVNFPRVLWPAWLICPHLNGRDKLLDWQVHHYHREWVHSQTNGSGTKQTRNSCISCSQPESHSYQKVSPDKCTDPQAFLFVGEPQMVSRTMMYRRVCVQSWLVSKGVQAQVRGVRITRLISHENILPYELSEISVYKGTKDLVICICCKSKRWEKQLSGRVIA